MSKHKDNKKKKKKNGSSHPKSIGVERSVSGKAKKHFSGAYDRESYLSQPEESENPILKGLSDDF